MIRAMSSCWSRPTLSRSVFVRLWIFWIVAYNVKFSTGPYYINHCSGWQWCVRHEPSPAHNTRRNGCCMWRNNRERGVKWLDLLMVLHQEEWVGSLVWLARLAGQVGCRLGADEACVWWCGLWIRHLLDGDIQIGLCRYYVLLLCGWILEVLLLAKM